MQKQKETTLKARWIDLWAEMGAKEGDSLAAYLRLHSAYSHNRFYHNFSHIGMCLKEFDAIKGNLEGPSAVEFAIWFHDVVYDTTKKDNEEKSAESASEILKAANMDAPFVQRVGDLITATKHVGNISDNDTKYLVDIDLSILGQRADVFEKYCKDIRREYSRIPEDEYRKGRIAVLESFSNRPRIYATDFFRDKYGAQARINIRRAIEKLQLRTA
jgi:predicted metal-dependent HD superfamily phosphohydrolase